MVSRTMLKEEKFTQDDGLGLPWFPEDNAPNDFMIQEQWLLVAGLNDRLEFPWFPEHNAQRREVHSR